MTIHKFSEVDKSQAWFKRLKTSLEESVAKLREKNDTNRDLVETAHLRGQIAALKELLKDMDDKPAPSPAPKRNPYQ